MVCIAFCIFAAALIGRLVFIQIVEHGFYQALAQGQRDSAFFTKGERGNIYIRDKNGNLITLATSQKMPFVFVSPPEIKDQQGVADSLSAILHVDKSSLFSKIQQASASQNENLYAVIKKRISSQEAQAIKDAHLKGVYVQDENVRFYPQNNFLAQVVGFTNQNGEGQYGIEKYYNNTLEGKEGMKIDIKNPAAYFLSTISDTTKNGSDIILTIDSNIQSAAEATLQDAKTNLGVAEGTIIVLDPQSGKIIALANAPTFNVNNYAKVKNFNVFQNNVIEQLFEPGSVFKAITMAGAINEGSITPDTTYIDKGILQIGGYKIFNYGNRTFGQKTMKDVLDFSINTGAVFAEQQLGNIQFAQYVKKFGILDVTGVDLPGEIYSQNSELSQGREINFATASFGQGIEMTSMQLVRAYSAIANGGRLPTPFIAEGAKPQLSDPIISKQTATTVTSMLVDVMENGYGKSSRIPGYYIAGKTGTAQIPWTALGVQKSGYSDETIQSFIGYAPAYNPQFLILIKLNSPQTKTAEYSAVPLFHKLAKYVIDYLEIPPDYEP